eukprot:TRINITY_DN15961_c0_g1_i2.p2 TRINITY_DN15961_c0_g1~~TRINITY_DN15961_c0_g1_i2.p2  ORF type:complete len:140 (-),score=2.75 TRINITY_DN15961_c0_g1_i2:5-424(-)
MKTTYRMKLKKQAVLQQKQSVLERSFFREKNGLLNYYTMDTIEKLLQQDVYRILLGVLLFILSVVITFIVYRQTIRLLKKKAAITKSKVDDFIIDILKIPVLWLLLWILFKIFSYSFISEIAGFRLVIKINNILPCTLR